MVATSPRAAPDWDYAPAPESADVVSIAPRYGLFIGGEFVAARRRRHFATLNPATEEPLAEVAQAGPPDVDRAVAAARAAYEGPWGAMPGPGTGQVPVPDRPGHPGAGPRVRGAGKPGQRQADQGIPGRGRPAGRRALLLLRGLGGQARATPGSARTRGPLGVAGQVIPWNFPLLMAAWKLAPALATGNTCVLKPAETTPLTALLLAQVIAAGRPAARHRQHPYRRRRHRAGPRRPPGRGQDRVHRVHRGGQGDPARGRRHRQAAHPGTGRQGREHRVRRRAARPGDRGHRQRHLLQPGPRVLRGLPAAGPGVGRRHRAGPAQAAARHAAPGRPAGQEHRHRRDQLAAAARQDHRAGRGRRGGRARSAGRRPCPLPDRGYWFPPTVFSGVSQSHRIAREEIFGPVLSVLTFRTPEEAVAKANNTPYGLSAGVWTEKGSRIFWMAQRLRAGVVWANTYNRFDPASPFGGYQESGFGREGGRAGAGRRTSMPDRRRQGPTPAATHTGRPGWPGSARGRARRLDVRKTYKLFIGGAFPRSESGRRYPVTGPDGTLLAHAALASRKDARDAVVAAAARRSVAGPGRPPTTAARSCTGWPRCSKAGRGSSPPRSCVAESHDRREAAQQVTRGDRPLGLVRGLAGQGRAGGRRRQPGGRAVLQHQRAGADRGGRGGRAARAGLLGLVSVLAPVIATGNTAVVVASGPAALPAVTLAEVLATSDVPRRRGQRADRAGGRAGAGARRAHGRERDRPDRGGPGGPGGAGAAARRTTSSGCSRPAGPAEDWSRPAGPRRMLAFLEPRPSGTRSAPVAGQAAGP